VEDKSKIKITTIGLALELLDIKVVLLPWMRWAPQKALRPDSTKHKPTTSLKANHPTYF